MSRLTELNISTFWVTTLLILVDDRENKSLQYKSSWIFLIDLIGSVLDDISSTELLINIENIYKRKRAIAKMTPKIGTITVNAPIGPYASL